ncbi:hypothetical protein NPX13_g8739 [Xylaria arbuscula]|uniref:Uncharacterized protein n=1 Tax=Xylaria arbuscula TaxID=114810 RepID=A0A9W8N811_9PEZI|nr:hypothetical protein NPX13_g8739 [Xylaria arbuscula]
MLRTWTYLEISADIRIDRIRIPISINSQNRDVRVSTRPKQLFALGDIPRNPLSDLSIVRIIGAPRCPRTALYPAHQDLAIAM